MRAKDQTAQRATGGEAPVASATQSAAHTGEPVLYTNPVSQLDPALGIVVLSFYNSDGVQTSSIPSQKQLESYRLHGDTTSGAADLSGLPPRA